MQDVGLLSCRAGVYTEFLLAWTWQGCLFYTFSIREASKESYLLSDTNCTYQFYEQRGFETVGEKNFLSMRRVIFLRQI